ncbi:MAG TPA: hypothetical protein VFY17_11165 [Pilimelia sp.]|nr:hypothetical protein [Pilimelia sp.]
MSLPETLAGIRPARLPALPAVLVGMSLLIGVLVGCVVLVDRPATGAAAAAAAATPRPVETPARADSTDVRHWGELTLRLVTQPAAAPRVATHRSGDLAAGYRIGPPTPWTARSPHRGPATDRRCDCAVLQIYRC